MKCPSPGQWDLHTLSNHDYFIARRAFFFDLATWGDETPVDDPSQTLGLDRQTFLQMMAALNRKAPNRMIKVGGFTPWAFKYTNHPGAGGKHGGVETEWEFARLISQFNGYMEADAIGLSCNGQRLLLHPLPAQGALSAAQPKAITIRLATRRLPHCRRKGSAQALRGLLRRRLRLARLALQGGAGFLLRPAAGPGPAGLGLRPEPRRPGAAGAGLCLSPRDDQRLLHRGRLRRRLPESPRPDGPSRFQAASGAGGLDGALRAGISSNGT